MRRLSFIRCYEASDDAALIVDQIVVAMSEL